MTFQQVDHSIKRPYGVVEDVLVKVQQFTFPVDFMIMDIEEDLDVPLILGRLFMSTAKCVMCNILEISLRNFWKRCILNDYI